MNIFVLDENPSVAAEMMCDKHVVKMIVESAQMLATIHHKHGIPVSYKPTHANHPCTIWAGETKENYRWLVDHGVALCREYTDRYEKQHKCEPMFHDEFWITPPSIPDGELTPFAQAMPEQYKHSDATVAYKQYYLGEKAGFAKWRTGSTPLWFVLKDPTLKE